jgi:LmbE family N-acetylglucosaminyl deacetylase
VRVRFGRGYRNMKLTTSCSFKQILWLCVYCSALGAIPVAQSATAPALQTDDRFKADILLIVAHSDDETGDVAGYLARAIYDQHKRVAVVFTTHSEASANPIGPIRGDALGAERDIEGRQALASLGISNVWFLNGSDNASQSVLRSLARWDHGAILGQVVRFVRLTRPEVILTWLPAAVAGENSSDHQAASVIANEAFDLAGDPAAFSEQLAVDPAGDGKPAEGLQPWQPKKIYYYSDAYEYPYPGQREPWGPSPFRTPFLEGKGPAYSNTDVSPTRHMPYSAFAAREYSFYLTVDGKLGVNALESQDFKDFDLIAHFILGKSLVGGRVTGDIFEGIVPGPIPYARLAPPAPMKQAEPTLELGGQWHFYRQFWRAHHLEHLEALLPIAEVAIRPGIDTLRMPLLIRNNTQQVQDVVLTVQLPQGWTDQTKFNEYRLQPGEVYPVQAVLGLADASVPRWQEIRWQTLVGGRPGVTLTLRVDVAASGAMPQ